MTAPATPDQAPSWARDLAAYLFPSKNPLDYVGWSSVVGLVAGIVAGVRRSVEDRRPVLALLGVWYAVLGFVLAEPAVIAAALAWAGTQSWIPVIILAVVRQVVASPAFVQNLRKAHGAAGHALLSDDLDTAEIVAAEADVFDQALDADLDPEDDGDVPADYQVPDFDPTLDPEEDDPR